MGWPLIGWASVPVTRANFSNPRVDDSIVSVAGPVSNVFQAFGWLLLLLGVSAAARAAGFEFGYENIKSIVNEKPDLSSIWMTFATVCAIGVMLNFSLAVFNLLPIPPFDGGFIMENLVPALRPFYDAVRPFSFAVILIILSVSPMLKPILGPVHDFAAALVLRVLGEDPQQWTSQP